MKITYCDRCGIKMEAANSWPINHATLVFDDLKYNGVPMTERKIKVDLTYLDDLSFDVCRACLMTKLIPALTGVPKADE